MQRGQGLLGAIGEERELHHVGMEVDHVELVGQGADLGQLGQMGGQVRLQWRGVQADGLVADGDKAGLGLGLGAGEQGDLVAKIDQSVCQVGDHPFGATIQAWRNGLVEGSDLGDLHGSGP